ncbi:MAG: molybdopterin-binding protein [Alphaproteobacteria bacterium]
MADKNPTAAVLIIGNEILSGRTRDSNLNYIAVKLTSVGIKLAEARVVADIEEHIVRAVNEMRRQYTYVFTTGGIGATHDDITADSIAKAFGRPIVENPEARKRLEAHYTAAKLNAARLRMARMPEGAQLIDNPVSIAPGFSVENVYVMAGVPNIMQSMMDHLITTLEHGPTIHMVSIVAQIPENVVADELAALAASYADLDIGSYPWQREGRWGTTLVVRGTDKAAVQKASQDVFSMVARNKGEPKIEETTLSAA